jgi:hypothetical protein
MRAGLIWAGVALAFVTACGGSVSPSTPKVLKPTGLTTPSSALTTVSAAPSREARMVIDDLGTRLPGIAHVRLARLDATDVGVMTGQFIGVFNDEAVALNGRQLTAMAYDGATTLLGLLAGAPAAGAGGVVLSPNLSQWLYTMTSDSQSLTAQVHLGSATGDRVVATIPSPNGNGIFAPYAWNSSGVYLDLQATGIGGAGPFLDYHFPLYRFDVSTGAVSQVEPACVGYDVLNSGAFICALNPSGLQSSGGLEIRSSNAHDQIVEVKGPFAAVTLSPDASRLALVSLGGTSADSEYQIKAAQIKSLVLADFGPPGYVPEAWLPDGRLVAREMCLVASDSPTACDASNDGKTYVFAADGSRSTFFFRLGQGVRIADVLV